MSSRGMGSVRRDLFLGLDALVVVLLLAAVALATPGRTVAAGLVALLILAIYVAGRLTVRVHERPVDAARGAWWPDAGWLIALLVPWLVLLWLSPGALWFAFPLMLLQMHVLGRRLGILAVVVTTTLAVAEGLLVLAPDGDGWVGYVLGPTLGAAVAIGVVLGLEALDRESRQRQRTVEELEQAREHLAQAERSQAVASERERLAREIHDTLAQSLSAIELLLRSARAAVGTDDERVGQLVEHARETARESLHEARRFVRDLSPTDLAETSLLEALRRAADRTQAQHGGAGHDPLPLVVTVHSEGEPRPLSVPVETALLRIAQSALANVSQHAGASRARVTLTYAGDVVMLDIVDDGRGFDTEAAESRPDRAGFGITAMRSRIRELGGRLAFESTPGEGTAVAVTLPAEIPEELSGDLSDPLPVPVSDVVPTTGAGRPS